MSNPYFPLRTDFLCIPATTFDLNHTNSHAIKACCSHSLIQSHYYIPFLLIGHTNIHKSNKHAHTHTHTHTHNKHNTHTHTPTHTHTHTHTHRYRYTLCGPDVCQIVFQ